MGTSVEQTHIERLHQELRSVGDELEKIGHDHILITVHQDHHLVFGSGKGKLFLQEHWDFITDFVKFCDKYAVFKSEVAKTSRYTDIDETESLPVNDTQSETNDFTCDETLNTPKPQNYGEDLFDCGTDTADVSTNHVTMELDSIHIKSEVSDTKQNHETEKRVEDRVQESRRRTRASYKEREYDTKTDGRKVSKRSVKTHSLSSQEVEERFMCNVCHAKLPSEELLKSHLNFHNDLKCSFCRKEFESVSELKAHKKEHLDNDTCYECKLCENKLYKFEWQLGQHMEKEHMDSSKSEEGHFPCLECGYVFQFQNHLDEHRQVMPNCRSEIPAKQKEEGFLESVFTFKDPQSGKVKTKTWRDLLAPDRKYPARCEICQKSMPIKCRYQRHVWTHADFKAHKCFICNKDFKFKEEIQKHLKVHNQRPFHCEHCHFKFDTEARRDHHVKLTCTKLKDKQDLVCKVCGQQFNSISKLNDHETVHTGQTPWKCDQCSFASPTKGQLTRHKRVDHNEVLPFRCAQCGLMFEKNEGLLVHMKSHAEKKVQCDICGQKLVNESNLQRHLQKTHREKKTYPCNLCGRVFRRSVRLREHLRRHTGEKPFICETCGMSFFKKARLVEHIRTHTGDKPFLCTFPECGKKFSTFSGLRVHRTIHNPNRCNVCDVCGRTFKNERNLQYHRKSHTQDRHWPCMYCEMKCRSLITYKTHLAKVHPDQKEDIERRTMIRIHKCQICSKMFGGRSDLKRHILAHKGLKPFKCPYCDKAFNDKSNLRTHKRVHTGDARFKCNYCSKGFSQQRILRLHLQEAHGETMNTNSYPENRERYSATQESASAIDSMLEDNSEDTRQPQQQQHRELQPVMVAEPLNQSIGFQSFRQPVLFTVDQEAMAAEPFHPLLGFQRYKPDSQFRPSSQS